MLKLLIADDEKNVREGLSHIINTLDPEILVLKGTDSVSSTIKSINEQQPDVVLLDIEMKEGTGFDVLKHFPSPKFKVIFITAFQQYAIEAFRFSAIDYILKPVDPDRLMETITRTSDIIEREKISLQIESLFYNLSQNGKKLKKVVLRTTNALHVVNTEDILYCEADRSYTTFYLLDKTRIMVSNTLGHYEEMFDATTFLRVHASFLVNMNYIKRYEKGDGGRLVLQGEIEIPVSKSKKDYLLQLLSGI